ncbi:gas vesicle protein GvpO [Streptomyces odonnellii]|uniref:gas vesicle protein GvpO n=1 Tax=Streptomyces odonnellii TaxID=1417980 RepID=UPI00099B9466|nr:gas vesicle protein [Streptomyces odonnellii]
MGGSRRRDLDGTGRPKTSGSRREAAGAGRGGEQEREPVSRPLAMGGAMREATEQLAGLLGTRPESVSAVKRTEEGWQADVEVLEISRVPDTTSVMASYRVRLDEEGRLTEYERRRRYARGQIDRK